MTSLLCAEIGTGGRIRISVSDYRLYCGRCRSLTGRRSRFCEQCGYDLQRNSSANIPVLFGRVVEAQGREPERLVGVFGDYVLLSVLGEGGMGQVFEAMKCDSGQRFAMKMVHESLRLRGGSHVQSLIDEGRRQASIVHPNVVRVFGFIQDPHTGRMALVLELIEGQSLDEALKGTGETGFDLQTVLVMSQHMTMGLKVVHQHGFIHADVKPGNFLYGRSGRSENVIKISDFGISRSLKEQLTGDGKRLRARTPGYSSPEQILNAPLGVQSDLYSLGCVMFELLTGQHVFSFDDFQRCDRDHVQEPAPYVPELRADVPRALAELVASLLRKSPAERPESADEVLAELGRIRL
jgi:serine/threonine protein kinase